VNRTSNRDVKLEREKESQFETYGRKREGGGVWAGGNTSSPWEGHFVIWVQQGKDSTSNLEKKEKGLSTCRQAKREKL